MVKNTGSFGPAGPPPSMETSGAFWTALDRGDDEEAFAVMREAALPSPGAPSPRAAELIANGEWDTTVGLSLFCVEPGACAGSIGGKDSNRFCGRQSCTVTSHSQIRTKTVITPGWYISVGGQSSGLFLNPRLPSAEDGGPIASGVAMRLLDGDNPFKMTKGQWTFVMEAWQEAISGKVQEDEEEEAEGEDDDYGPFSAYMRPPAGQVLAAAARASAGTLGEAAADDGVADEPTPVLTGDPTLMALVQQLQRLVVGLQTRCTALEQEQRTTTEIVDNGRRRLEAVVQDVVLLHEQVDRPIPPANLPTEALQRLNSCYHACYESEGALGRLKQQLVELREQYDTGGGVECNGVKFNTKRDLVTWFTDRNVDISLFMDGHALLHAVQPAVATMAETMRLMEAQQKVNHTSLLETYITTSFATVLPSSLAGGKVVSEGTNTAFKWLLSTMPTYEAWRAGGRGAGVGKTIATGVDNVAKQVKELRLEATEDDAVRMLSAGLIHDSITFCHELVRYVDDQNRELTKGTGYSDKQVWEMLVECVQKVMEELSAARSGIAAAARHQKALYLWGMLKAWTIQQRYLENGFKDDPALTGVLVRRILMQSDNDNTITLKLEKLEELTKKLESNHRSYQQEIQKLQNQVDRLKK